MVSKKNRVEAFEICAKDYLPESKAYELCEWLDKRGFFDAPASTKYHGAYEGGLFDHSFNVYSQLNWLTEKNDLTWQHPRSPFIVAMLHDVCKMDQYKDVSNEANAPKYEYVKQTLLTGHGEKSLMLLLTAPIQLTEEEIVCIRYHMGAFTDKEQWGDYTNAIHQYENVLWTHQADMLASHVKGI